MRPLVTESGVPARTEPTDAHLWHVAAARAETEARDHNGTRDYPDEWLEFRRAPTPRLA